MEELLAKQRLLVVSPHADDEAFGCAGTMAKIKDLGGEVYVMTISIGDLQHYGESGYVERETRKKEFIDTTNEGMVLSVAKFLDQNFDIAMESTCDYCQNKTDLLDMQNSEHTGAGGIAIKATGFICESCCSLFISSNSSNFRHVLIIA